MSREGTGVKGVERGGEGREVKPAWKEDVRGERRGEESTTAAMSGFWGVRGGERG